MRMFKYVVCCMVITAAVTACEKKGPAERAGEKIDNAVEKAGDKIQDAGDKIEDATDRK